MNPTKVRRILLRSMLGLLALGLGLYALAIFLFDGLGLLTPKLPAPNPVAAVQTGETTVPQYVALPQNWSPGWEWGGREWFHHADQGTTIMPYDWLVALDQPEIKIISRTGRFLDPEYMSRFGFLPSVANPALNPEGILPIGWAIHRGFVDPTANLKDENAYNAKPYDAVGLTCAACHTGRLTYVGVNRRKVELLIDGGSAMINLRALQSALGTAVAYTLYVPGRFERFAERVLGKDASRKERDHLRGQVSGWFQEAKKGQERDDARHVNQLESGFARTDALSLIGNRVFGSLDPSNVMAAGAPVNFPHLWGTAWFDWVQYNASIKMVMVRNIGEALGVGARTNVTPGDPRLLQSTVNVENLHKIEDQLGGTVPFGGLIAPKWEDAVRLAGFPPLQDDLKSQGEALYVKNCRWCHGPPVDELKIALKKEDTTYWEKLDKGVKPPVDQWILKVPKFSLSRIGTDPSQAADFAFRFAKLPDPTPRDTQRGLKPLGSERGSVPASATSGGAITATAAHGLRVITEAIREQAYVKAGLTPEERAQWDRYRDHRRNLPDDDVLVANLDYKARPLDGIWATPPYLHNASVPNLDALLSPVALRPVSFPLGTTLYDTDKVGYRTDENPGNFLLDTELQGNANSGHEFRDLTLVELEGIAAIYDLGTGLSVDARWARLLKITPEEYEKQSEDQRRRDRHELTRAALEKKHFTLFGVIGPGFEPGERRALIEYLKSL